MLLLLVHLIATAALTGLVWVVQVVVYPSFLRVGSTSGWRAVHDAHSRTMAVVVAVPWTVQGVSVAALLLRDGPSPLLVVTALLALSTAVVTVAVSVPLHAELGRAYDDAVARRLVRTNWLRTAAWTGGTLCAAALVLGSAG